MPVFRFNRVSRSRQKDTRSRVWLRLALLAVVLLSCLPASAGAAQQQPVVGPLASTRAVPTTLPSSAAPTVPAQTQPTTTYTNSILTRGFVSNVIPQTYKLTMPRYRHQATLLADGTVLLTGGSYNQNAQRAERFDPITNTSSSTGSMLVQRVDYTATLLTNGKVLIVGGYFDGHTYSSAELYDPATGTFTFTGSLSVPRSRASATLLPDGKVLIVGGTSATKSAELYDPATGTFTTTGSLVTTRYSHVNVLLHDGTVLVAGGSNNTSSYLTNAEIYNPATGTFTTTGSLQVGRSGSAAVVLADGRVLIASGYSSNSRSAEVYDPATGTFSLTGNTLQQHRGDLSLLPNGKVLLTGSGYPAKATTELYDPATGTWAFGPLMQEPREDGEATVLQDHTVLLTGGKFLDTAERYDPVTNTFLPTSDLKAHRSGHTATLLPDGDVLLVGSPTESYRTELYDTSGGGFVRTPDLSERRWNHTATRLPNGKVLLAGGTSQTYLKSAELYDPATRTFTTTGSLNVARYGHTATLLPDGKVLIVGGYNDTSKTLASAELYNPATGTFTTTGSLQNAREFHTATLLPSGKVLIAGGFNGTSSPGSYPAVAELYDPATGTFSSTGSLVTPRTKLVATVLDDGTVLLTGGENNNGTVLPSAELYDPTTGAFSAVAPMQQARRFHTATRYTDGSVIVAGGEASVPLTSVERYDPDTKRFTTIGNLQYPRSKVTATLLDERTVLYAGGVSGNTTIPSDTTAERAFVNDLNRFTASLTLPNDWIGATTPLTFTAATTGTALTDGSLNEGPWIPATSGADVTTTLERGVDGRDKPISLRLRDADGTVVEVVTATADIDLTAPTSSMTALPAMSTPAVVLRWSGSDATSGVAGYDVEVRDNAGAWTRLLSNTTALTTTFTGVRTHTYQFRVRARDAADNVEAWAATFDAQTQVDPVAPQSSMQSLPVRSLTTFTLRWSGSDNLSGVVGYDLEVRDGADGTWTPVLTNTSALSTTFTGEQGHLYQFRVRATDGAANVEDWPAMFDTQTTIDSIAPVGSFTINKGALATTGINVVLTLRATDTQSPVEAMRIALDGTFGDWQPYDTSTTVMLAAPNGEKVIGVRFRDTVGNVSDPITQTIRLDRTVDSSPTLSIDDAAIYTTVPTVTLSIGAPPRTAAMQISNNGSFTGDWLPFDTRAAWTLDTYSDETISYSVYVRTRNVDGTVSVSFSDSIIYDPIAPTGSITITNVTAQSVQVRLAASDDFTRKVNLRMRVSTNAQFSGATWQAYATSATVPRRGDSTRVYAQFEDAAGNQSAVVAAGDGAADGHQVFLPLVWR